MNDHSDQNPKTLSLTELEHIDQVQAQFRAAWESGTRPRIEDFLADASGATRAELLVRLLAEELACRSRVGETPTAEEYEQRFPADAETVRQAFSRSTPSPPERSEENTHSRQQAAFTETETQAWEPPAAKLTSVPGRPEFIGRYKVVGVLGRGGFGAVYRARDEQLERDVAIKVWRRDRFAGDEAVEHLLQEARHVARLDEHPSIVGVHDVGRQADGSAFVVFQYIEGHSLAEELKSHPVPPDRVWEVMIQVTSAIQHAHATGLVHRDLKPANVLLDKDGNARVADFGLALDDQSQRLHAGEVSGTPAYMSPEQVRGEAHRLDGRTDLWALGVMLYEMLVHRRPFQGQTRQGVFDEILHRDPKPPRQLNPQLPADLERICLKCLSKDATQRYLTAADLAKDLRHAHQAPQRRKRRMMTIASVVAAGMLILAAFWGYLTQQGEQPVISVQPGAGLIIRHRTTLRGHSDAVWCVAFSPDDRTLASAGVDRTIKLWEVLAGHEALQLTGHRGEVRQVAFSPDGQTLASASGDRSIAVWDRETGELQHQLIGHEGDVRSVTFLPAGNQLVSGSVDRTIRFWEVESGSQQQEIATHRAAVQSVICSRDGRTLASASDDRMIQLRSTETGELLLTLTGHTDGVIQVAFSPDGRRLVSAGWDKTIRIWDIGSGKLLRTIDKPESAVRSVAFSPDGRRLVSGGEDHTIRLWDAETGVELATLRGHHGSVTSVAFSSDGRILASASADKTVMMWELEEASPAKPAEPPKSAKVDRKPVKIPPAPPQEPPLAIAPFDAATARKHQEAWAAHLGKPLEVENSIGMKFVLIPPGEFMMGSTEEEVEQLLQEAKQRKAPQWYIDQLSSESPRHRVRITRPFYLGSYEVTQAEYQQVTGVNPSYFSPGGGGSDGVSGLDTSRHPVEMVSWDDANAFCEKLSAMAEERAEGRVYVLPTEAQWEYACRAGTTTKWSYGDGEAVLRDYAWYQTNSGGRTHAVGEKKPNAFGLFDMHGNVWEWCADWHAADYYAASPVDDPQGPASGSDRMTRGGGCIHHAGVCRSALRSWHARGDRGGLGFRLAHEPAQPVAIRSPLPDQTLACSADEAEAVTVEVQIGAPDRAVREVTLHLGNRQLGSRGQEPWTFTWQKPAAGWQQLTACVRFEDGEEVRSQPVSVYILAAETPASLPAVTKGLVASYPLNEGGGRMVRDRSGSGVAPDLGITPGTSWLEGGPGLRFQHDHAGAWSERPARRLIEQLRNTAAFTIELWMEPDELDQDGPARLITLSQSMSHRNLTLGHGQHGDASRNLLVRLRTTNTDANGMPDLVVPNAIVAGRAQYVVTYAGQDVAVYRDGRMLHTVSHPGAMSNWSDHNLLVLGNETDGDRAWRGRLYRVAIYDRALNADEVRKNFDAGLPRKDTSKQPASSTSE